jgi:hypothetical protein
MTYMVIKLKSLVVIIISKNFSEKIRNLFFRSLIIYVGIFNFCFSSGNSILGMQMENTLFSGIPSFD